MMPLTGRERAIAAVGGALTAYALGRDRGEIPPHVTPHGFVAESVPGDVRDMVTADMIDEIFDLAANRS